jgi:hypothetical protein
MTGDVSRCAFRLADLYRMAAKIRNELLRSAKVIGTSHGYQTIECAPCKGSATVQLDDELLEAIGMEAGDRCPVCLGFGVLFHDPDTDEHKDAYGLLERLGVIVLPGLRNRSARKSPGPVTPNP